MNARQRFMNFPGKMTAADYNIKRGLFSKLPYINMAGDLSNNCYIRRTPSGFVLYKMNGYIQPILVHTNGQNKYLKRCEPAYINAVLNYIQA